MRGRLGCLALIFLLVLGGIVGWTPLSNYMAQPFLVPSRLERADAIVIATPMHNLGVPSVLKTWIDHVVRAGRTFDVSSEGKKGRIADRPVFVAIASGGRFSGEHARQPDFLTPYLKAVLGTIGLTNITFFSIQGTGLGPVVVENARRMAARNIEQHFALEFVDA